MRVARGVLNWALRVAFITVGWLAGVLVTSLATSAPPAAVVATGVVGALASDWLPLAFFFFLF
jgi:hypothetical protein